MAQLVVRNIPDDVKEALRARAAQSHRSMEAEVRAILVDAVSSANPVMAWLDAAATVRAEHGGIDLPAPARTRSRAVEPL